MLAWQSPSATAEKEEDEKERSECLAKEKQEMSSEIAAKIDDEESSLFYSDLMPMLVSDGALFSIQIIMFLGVYMWILVSISIVF